MNGGDVENIRNVSIGGKARIDGSMNIGHNLKVEGWLDAPNIKGSNKGVFLTLADLNSAYPAPIDGWYAGVVGSNNSVLLYTGWAGSWVNSGETLSVTLDVNALSEMQEDIDAATTAVGGAVDAANNAVSIAQTAQSMVAVATENPTAFFAGIDDSEEAEVLDSECPGTLTEVDLRRAVYFVETAKKFAVLYFGQYYSLWNNGGNKRYMALSSSMQQVPIVNKLYVRADGTIFYCTTDYLLTPAKVDTTALERAIQNAQEAADAAARTANAALPASTFEPYKQQLDGAIPENQTLGQRIANIAQNASDASDVAKLARDYPTMQFKAIVDGLAYELLDTQCPTTYSESGMIGSVHYYTGASKFIIVDASTSKCYTRWGEGAERLYNNEANNAPNAFKLFANMSTGQLYVYHQNVLTAITVDLTTVRDSITETNGRITALSDRVDGNATSAATMMAPRLFVNVMKLMNRETVYNDMVAMLEAVAGRTDAALYQVPGVVLTFQTSEGWQTMQWQGSIATGEDEDWSESESWKKIGGAASVGNCYNVTVDAPLAQNEFYDLDGAIAVAWERGYKSVGMQITFAITSTTWKTYQYVGPNNSESNFTNVSYWIDLAGMSAGAETLINVDALCGACTQAQYYNLSYAVTAINALSQSSGISYAKSGLIITYKTGSNTWETKQFVGNVADFGEVGLWHDFGSGGEVVQTSDEPEQDGEDAFSTGGAYEHIPATLAIDTETEGVVKMKMVNAEGGDIGDEVQFAVGTGGGGGGGTGTIVSIAYQDNPLVGDINDLVIHAAVRSVTTVGSSEQENMIATIDIYDRDTNTLLETIQFNRASSMSMSDYSFAIDMTSYFNSAGRRNFKLVATDDTGNTGSRNIQVAAVDVTISSTQTLQYTDSTALRVGGVSRDIPLYKFANNASVQGITAITEIYLDGQWQELGRTVVTDTYSHNITINPNNCLGETLTHGVYLLRVHGVDVNSGVVGNYLYTSIFVIDPTSTVPLVVTSWYADSATAHVQLYETIKVNFAVYDPTTNAPTAVVNLNGHPITTQTAHRSSAYTFTHQVTGVASDGSVTESVTVNSGLSSSPTAEFVVSGSVIAAVIKAGAIYAFDFANRSNQETDHSIESGDFNITLQGVNWNTTGFVPMTAGGEMALRVSEDMTGALNHKPFKPTSIESNGLGIQFAFASKNLVDDDAILLECYEPGVGAGFYVTGRAVGIYCASGLSNHVEERAYRQGEKVTVAVVVEPAIEGLGQTRDGDTYYFIKLYLNGEEVAVIGYMAGGSNLIQERTINMYGTQGDLYLYYIMAWNDYFQFDQAFQNYLVKLTDTTSMVREYDFESVMASQQITEQGVTTTKLRPQAALLAEGEMAYFIECPYGNTNIEGLDNTTSTKDQIYVNLYYVDPKRPWTNFISEDTARRNQGTTSAKRPVKNPRYYLAKKKGSTYNKVTQTGGTTIRLMYTREQIVAMGYDGALWDKANALAAINKVQIHEDSIPVDIITVKVDFSDSSNANDCGVCDMMNATFKALGGQYLTPAQRAFDGTWTKGSIELTGLSMNHSTANFPIAMYRSKESTGASPYFHAKGNWKEDKKEQTALGFINTPGYTKGCLNYGDFVEFYGKSAAMLVAEGETGRTTDETLVETKARFLATSGLDTTKTYALTQYCGSSYKVMKYVEGQWEEQTGSMVQNANGRWTVTGSVLNPTDGFELLNYQGMDWFKGVSSVADLMAPSQSYSKWVQALIDGGDISVESVPAWTYYYESLVDDDDLAIAYAMGKKVPYNLLRWMMFCNTCDYDLYSDTALTRWKAGLWRFACPQSVMAYSVFTDYCAAVDQRAKNMQPMWFLEDGCKVVNGVYYNADNETYANATGMMPMRMYLNKVYDCDTCNGKDNDGGQTIDAEVDPNKMPDAQTGYTNPYAGYNSVLFRNLYLQQSVYIDGNNTELALKTVASAMRSCTATVDGITMHPFSPEGAQYFFVTSRIKRWPKKVSSYDGERKYIDFTATSDAIYFYALQGLGLTSLPAFIERRWRIRDGFYGTGDFFSGVLSGRVNSANDATITIKAAKTGYFGIGNDSSGSLSKSVYLEAGESYTFAANTFSHEEGALLYIYQADRMSEIDLSQISLSNTFSFGVMTLAEKIILGSDNKVNMTIGAYQPLTDLRLGELPFLRELDIRGTIITNVVCSGCPRLQTLKASGSQLVRADIADGSKITSMVLPSTYQDLKLRYLPDMEMSGIVLANAASIRTLVVEQCAKINPLTMLRSIAGATNSALSTVRVTGVAVTDDGSDLADWSTRGWSGLDINLTAQEAPALSGVYMLSQYTNEESLAAWQTAFPELIIHQAQYTLIVQDDTTSQRNNVKNLDNNTGYGTEEDYAPSGHILKILAARIPVLGRLNDGNMECVKLSRSDYKKLLDGTTYNVSYYLNNDYDAFMYEPRYWYKGINDFKNEKKYTAFSSLSHEPLSSANVIRRSLLSALTPMESMVLSMSAITENVSTLEDTGVLQSRNDYNVYQFDVEGMKQVRWPGLNNSYFGVCFLDAEGVIISKYAFANNSNDFDFDESLGDYLFINVPNGAKTFVFTTRNTNGTKEVIAVDSTEVEAIEPDWVEHKPCLGAIYEASVIDASKQLRSMTGQTVKVGTGTATTWTGWSYLSNGKLNTDLNNGGNVPMSGDSLNYTCKDFQNLAYMRGEGYQLFDYEMSKDVALLTMAKVGDRDGQRKFGTGKSSGGSTGYLDSIGAGDSTYSSGNGNKVLGYESFMACTYEWMDRVAVNVISYKSALAGRMNPVSGDPVNAVWHIYDPESDTERTVQGLTTSGQTVARTRHGRHCDIIASKFTGESNFSSHYADGQYYTASTCRVVGRSYSNAGAHGGLVYSHANNASSHSGTYSGSRLAFRPPQGKQIIIAEE